jgi:hypothetical protein
VSGVYLYQIAATIASAFIIAASTYVIKWVRSERTREGKRERKLDRILEAFEGVPADPYSGRRAQPGLLTRLGDVEIGLNADSTKLRVLEALLRQHFVEFRAMTTAMTANDLSLRHALREAGFSVPEPSPLTIHEFDIDVALDIERRERTGE